MANTMLPDFPQPWGSKTVAVLRHTGPASYTAVTGGATPTGGDSIPASAFGLSRIEAIYGGMDDTAVYSVVASLAGKQEARSAILMWKTAATGAEVAGGTNLSAKSVFLIAIGY